MSDDLGVEHTDGGRILLRRLTASDVRQEYLDWFEDETVTEFLDSRELTQESVVEYIESGAVEKLHYMYGIFDIESGRHIGNIKIGPIQWNHLVSDLV